MVNFGLGVSRMKLLLGRPCGQNSQGFGEMSHKFVTYDRFNDTFLSVSENLCDPINVQITMHIVRFK